MLLSGIYASGSSTDPLPVSEQQTNAQEILKQWREQGLTQLTPPEERKMNIFFEKTKTSGASAVKIENPITNIRFMSGQPIEFSYRKNNYYVKYDDKIFIFPENSINKPTVFINTSKRSFQNMYVLKLQSLDDKTLQFIPIGLFKVDDKNEQDIQNERI